MIEAHCSVMAPKNPRRAPRCWTLPSDWRLFVFSHVASKPIKATAIATCLNCCSALSFSSFLRQKLKLRTKVTPHKQSPNTIRQSSSGQFGDSMQSCGEHAEEKQQLLRSRLCTSVRDSPAKGSLPLWAWDSFPACRRAVPACPYTSLLPS